MDNMGNNKELMISSPLAEAIESKINKSDL